MLSRRSSQLRTEPEPVRSSCTGRWIFYHQHCLGSPPVFITCFQFIVRRKKSRFLEEWSLGIVAQTWEKIQYPAGGGHEASQLSPWPHTWTGCHRPSNHLNHLIPLCPKQKPGQSSGPHPLSYQGDEDYLSLSIVNSEAPGAPRAERGVRAGPLLLCLGLGHPGRRLGLPVDLQCVHARTCCQFCTSARLPGLADQAAVFIPEQGKRLSVKAGGGLACVPTLLVFHPCPLPGPTLTHTRVHTHIQASSPCFA